MIDNINQLVAILKILADRTRLEILSKINNRELCVCEILEGFTISQPAISQHLRKMRDLNIVVEEKRGQWNYYRINENNPYYDLIKDITDRVKIS